MKRNEKGFILIAAYLVVVVFIVLAAAFISKSVTESNIARRERNFIQALYLAEAGIDYGLAQLRSGVSSGDNSHTWAEIGTYNCTWDPIESSNRSEIVSTGTVGDSKRQIRVELQEDTFARYLYFTDDEHYRWQWWRIPVWFVSGDYIGGPLQTNSHLHISGDPIFADPNFDRPVKTSDDFIEYMHGGPPEDNPDFQDGLQMGSDTIPFPSKALRLRTEAVQNGYSFEASGSQPAQILLNSDGTMTVTDNHRTNETMPLPDNGAVFVNGGNVEISGILSGQLSIGTNRNIVINDNLTYNEDPRVNPESTDTLGLIAEKDVVISQSAPQDVEIQASIMALGSSFTVENWWEGPPKGTLSLYGGLIQEYRGPVGTFDPDTNTKLSGYTKDYQYDSRLMETPPPFYPTTGDYVIISWKEQ